MSYWRTRGLFAGLALSGATVHIDHRANTDYYAHQPGQLQVSIPASATALAQVVTSYAAPPRPAQAPVLAMKDQSPPLFTPPDECEAVRQQLVAAALRLQPVLDPTWQKYLALPPKVFTGQPLPPGTTFDPVLRRFRMVSNDRRYRVLSEHHEFQETQALLRRYAALNQPRPAGTLSLPLPPGH